MTKKYFFITVSLLAMIPLLSLRNAPHTVQGVVWYRPPLATYPTTKLAGVDVIVGGTSLGTQTDSQGRYYLTIPDGSKKLTFMFLGLGTQTINVNNRTVINVELVEEMEARKKVDF